MGISKELQDRAKAKANEIIAEFYESRPLKHVKVPIKEVIESYIGDVNYVISINEVFAEGISAFATKDMETGWLIAVNGKECVERQRFSAAHELGHIAFLKTQEKRVNCSTHSKSWEERACDFFAGCILMPEGFVRLYYETNPFPYLEDIAKIFKVSRPVAEIQLGFLGLPFKNSRVGEGYIRF